MVSEQQAGILEYENHRDNEEEEEDEEQEEESEEDSDDDINTALYRHHEPIYLNAEDSENLFSDEEEDFNSNTYFPIMEVAAEYIDSRKSSGLESEPRKQTKQTQPAIDRGHLRVRTSPDSKQPDGMRP